ncbi:hypothetical protein M758_7G163100 [Ceratodon purpureus]|nr:hypothetical protein M758_7G163100 [Ceratodon purpureus]
MEMNPRIWSQLQYHIDMKMIFAKLPFREFFQMRLVCKEWNRLASDRGSLEESFRDPIPKPYFVVSDHGLLAYEASSGSWSCTPLPPRLRLKGPEVEGLLYSIELDSECQSFDRQEVFNVHTRVSYRLPQVGKRPISILPMVGMMVDTSVSPYSFQIILGSNENRCTQFFDSKSNSWTERRSKFDHTNQAFSSSCVHENGFLYMNVDVDDRPFYDYIMDYYDLEKDEWGKVYDTRGGFHEIGSWQGSLFDVHFQESWGETITVFELKLDGHPGNEAYWSAYADMPHDLFSWLTHGVEIEESDILIEKSQPIDTRFCSEYLLIHTIVSDDERRAGAERFVLFNLATKAWEKLQLPALRRTAAESSQNRELRYRSLFNAEISES